MPKFKRFSGFLNAYMNKPLYVTIAIYFVLWGSVKIIMCDYTMGGAGRIGPGGYWYTKGIGLMLFSLGIYIFYLLWRERNDRKH